MTNHQFVTVTRTLLKRAYSDVERKVAAMAASGALGVILLDVLKAYGINVPPNVAEMIPWIVGVIGGYAIHSVGSTTTYSNDATTATVTGPGKTVLSSNPLTGAIPIPNYPAPERTIPTPAPAPSPAPIDDPEPIEVPDQAPTQAFTSVLTGANSSRAASILNTLPSSGGTPVAVHDSEDGH